MFFIDPLPKGAVTKTGSDVSGIADKPVTVIETAVPKGDWLVLVSFGITIQKPSPDPSAMVLSVVMRMENTATLDSLLIPLTTDYDGVARPIGTLIEYEGKVTVECSVAPSFVEVGVKALELVAVPTSYG